MPKPLTTTYLHPFIVVNQVAFQFFNTIFGKMFSPLTTTYLIPAILLNPCVVLHFLNTGISRINPSIYTPSTSHAQWLESLGPLDNEQPMFDMHGNEGLCWGYTMVMVVVQILAFGKVGAARAAKRVRP